MALDQPWLALTSFIRTRFGLRFSSRAALETHQEKRLAIFLACLSALQPYFKPYQGQPLSDWPCMSKTDMIQNFERYNRLGISYEAALLAAQQAGRLGDVTAGLSSGTSGRTGVFLADGHDRSLWAGVLLARVLDAPLLRRLFLKRQPLRVAFFLRSNSQLYSQVGGGRINFQFFDLFQNPDTLMQELLQLQPEVLIAPAQVLLWLARSPQSKQIRKYVRKVISVAEVLEVDARAAIETAWSLPVFNLYQATEGFLAYTCAFGNLHLNEEYVHIEPEWLDDQKQRFVPIITDFTRQTQWMVRYRLDDVLVTTNRVCPCGKHTRVIDAIEGRSDDALWAKHSGVNQWQQVFPDALRAVSTHLQGVCALSDYAVVQNADIWRVSLTPNDQGCQEAWQAAMARALNGIGLELPTLEFSVEEPQPFHLKKRRIRCAQKPLNL